MNNKTLSTLKMATLFKRVFVIITFIEALLTLTLIIMNIFYYEFALFNLMLTFILVFIIFSIIFFSMFIYFYKKFIREKYYD